MGQRLTVVLRDDSHSEPHPQTPIANSNYGFSLKPTFFVFDPRYVGNQLLPVLCQSVFKPFGIKTGAPINLCA